MLTRLLSAVARYRVVLCMLMQLAPKVARYCNRCGSFVFVPMRSSLRSGQPRLPRGRWHCRRVMVHNHPVLPILHEREAVARRKCLGFCVFYKRKGVVARIDSGGAIHTDQLLTECHLEIGQHLERRARTAANWQFYKRVWCSG